MIGGWFQIAIVPSIEDNTLEHAECTQNAPFSQTEAAAQLQATFQDMGVKLETRRIYQAAKAGGFTTVMPYLYTSLMTSNLAPASLH